MKHTMITISREYGSGGRDIGQLVAEKLGIPCYDRSIIDKAAQISELHPDFIERNEQHLDNSFLFDMTMTVNVYKAQAAAIRACVEKGSCVIIGRCADKVLDRDFSCLKVFLYADFDERCRRAVSEYGKDEKSVRDLVKKTDRGRERFFQLFHETAWKDTANYHLCIDTGSFGIPHSVVMIEQAYHWMNEEKTI